MKLLTFLHPVSGQARLGALAGGSIVDLHQASSGRIPTSMLDFLVDSEALFPVARELAERPPKSALHPVSLPLKAPLPNPGALRDFFAFEEHAKAGSRRRGEELPAEWYEVPAYYKGNHREIYGPDALIPWPSYTRRLDFECEIACVVGRKGRDLSPGRAADHIFGYMIFNDFSARDIQKKEMVLRMGPAKGKDFANAFGPWLLSADEASPSDFAMTVRVNGAVWSRGRFAEQHWGFPLMLSHVSQCESVYPGDILGSGTFHGGCGLDLDRWLKPGDTVELEVPALGTLRSRIGSPAAQRELNYKKREAGA